jgi:hypothetical protein
MYFNVRSIAIFYGITNFKNMRIILQGSLKLRPIRVYRVYLPVGLVNVIYNWIIIIIIIITTTAIIIIIIIRLPLWSSGQSWKK